MTTPLRRPAGFRHPGTVVVDRLWFPAPDRDRLLSVWEPGTDVRELGPGWVVLLPRPRTVDARRAPAVPLLPVGGRSTSAPISDADLAAAPTGSVVVLHGARLWIAQPSELPRIDPSRWLDVDGLPLLDLEPLGPPPPPPVLVAAPLTTSVRARLGVPAAPEALSGLLSAMGRAAQLPAVASPAAQARATAQRALANGLGALGSWLGSAVGRPEPGPDGAMPEPTAGQRLLDTLERWSERLGLGAALESVVGQHNARYLQDMLSQFDQENWLDAIQRAIPLGGEGSGGPGQGGRSWLRSLDGIQFRGPRTGSTRAIGGDPTLYDHLKRLYRRAFQELDAQGMHKEAAYVLSDLLGEVGEAVTYLEDKGRYELAAELAEARRLDAGLIVLLWLRAGDVERAVAVATMRRAWAAAVTGLERRELREEALRLRTLWAAQERSAGRVLAAVDIAWPVPELRELAKGWLDEAIAAGGAGGAQALAKSLVHRPERALDDLRTAFRIADDEAAEGPVARRALAAALGTTEVERRALRAVARGLLRDAAPSDDSLAAALITAAATRAVQATGDGALVADLPPLRGAPAPSWPARVDLASRPEEAGTTAIRDVVRLPRGRWLVALGDLGALLLGPDGRRLLSWAAPAHALVPSPDGSKVILVGRRADRLRLHRLDTATRATAPWCEASFDRFAPTWDGTVWFVAEKDRVIALDGAADGLRALWSVDRLTGADMPVLALDASPTELRIVVRVGPGEIERFQYELPSLQLRVRQAWPVPAERRVLAVTERGVITAGLDAVEHASSGRPEISTHHRKGRFVEASAIAGWDAVTMRDRVLLLQPAGLAFTERAELILGGAERCGARFCASPDEPALPPWLVVFDDRGRVRAVDLGCGALAADLRI